MLIDLRMLQKQQQRLRLYPHFSFAPLHFDALLSSDALLFSIPAVLHSADSSVVILPPTWQLS